MMNSVAAKVVGFTLVCYFELVAAEWSKRSGRLPLIPYPAKVVGGADGEWAQFAKSVSLEVAKGIPSDSVAVQEIREQVDRLKGSEEPSSFLSSLLRPGILIRRHKNEEDTAGIRTVALSLAEQSASSDDESYHLQVTNNKVTLSAPTHAGLFYGAQTLKQLMHFGGKGLPLVTIEDAPRFKWRGMMLDTSRHFFTAAQVKSLIETMSTFKMNRFHWHLTDDQGWRMPVEGYPSLTQIGAEGVSSGSYSAKEISDVVKFANDRFIEVMPEVDLPGHVQAAVAAYPELGNTDISGWRKPDGPSKQWGVMDYTLAPTTKVMGFLDNVFTSVHDLFPGKWVHIGGDEVKTGEWIRSPSAATSASQLGEDTESLQSFFNHKVTSLLETKGRRTVSWDESQHIGGLPANTIIMAWRSVNEARIAARHGRDVINADSAAYYLDHYQGSPNSEPKAICCHTSLAEVYNYDPMPSGLTPDEEKHVLGGQGQLWSEYFPNWHHVEYMAHPRSIALAERLWTAPDAIVGYSDFVERLRTRVADLEEKGVNFRHLDA